MVGMLRTGEDHNGDGNQVAPRPMAYASYAVGDFTSGVKVHTLSDDTSLVYYRLTSSEATLTLLMPLSPGPGTWPLPAGVLWPASEIGDRAISITLSDIETAADIVVEIWEF